MTKTTAIYDYDFLKYALASAGEKRYINVEHKEGLKMSFPTATDFYGRAPKYSGGWLWEHNAQRIADGLDPLQIEDFVIETIQEAEPIANVLNSCKRVIKNINERLGVKKYRGYLGRGDSWRVEASTLLKYKGTRTNAVKPLLLKDVEEYLLNYHNAELVTHLEADDKCVMDCYNNPHNILVGVDKDYFGVCKIRLYNPDQFDKVEWVDGLGNLFFLEGNKVKGLGRKFFYFQVASSDPIDNYRANCFSDKRFGNKGAFDVLNDCKTDKECWQKIVDTYKILYPEKKTVVGWRGNEIEIDWLYVLQENVTMAHMLRWSGDSVNVINVLERMGVEY